MRGTGYILQYSPSDQRGMIHLGGGDHSALLAFALSDCDETVRDELKSGEIPSGPAVKVQLDVAIRKGGLWATNVTLAGRKAATSAKNNSKASRKRAKKAAAKRKR